MADKKQPSAITPLDRDALITVSDGRNTYIIARNGSCAAVADPINAMLAESQWPPKHEGKSRRIIAAALAAIVAAVIAVLVVAAVTASPGWNEAFKWALLSAGPLVLLVVLVGQLRQVDRHVAPGMWRGALQPLAAWGLYLASTLLLIFAAAGTDPPFSVFLVLAIAIPLCLVVGVVVILVGPVNRGLSAPPAWKQKSWAVGAFVTIPVLALITVGMNDTEILTDLTMLLTAAAFLILQTVMMSAAVGRNLLHVPVVCLRSPDEDA
ncbi:hypothetical protein GOHSU_46_00340 [Gordonia hirsuta DSM 44140 = NBRC 16056]|uniref:Uncharacterized protein n=1 Tax=Gordonia hirsuta DSM 44140 = NBRC 16056 TaxID=1121927 RepID=L7LF78_9ACTN|nr:hypothetical protein [Gordonia hirsuta]GAC58713.1 hypothetical protein GOHSU_46_00340 [Gordonia hirsuta DSM 44140 = NBRC 16056]